MTDTKNLSSMSLESRALEILEYGRELTDEDIEALRSDEKLREICRDLLAVAEVGNEENMAEIVDRERKRVINAINTDTAKKTKIIDWSFLKWGIAAVLVIVFSLFMMKPHENGILVADEHSYIRIDSTQKEVTLTTGNGENLLSVVTKTTKGTQMNFAALDVSELEAEKITVTVPRGKTYKLILADGTEAYMYPDSRLLFPTKFIGKERRVILYGEAFFNVTKDKEHPFVIETARMQTKVLGTQFHVSDYNDADKTCTVTLVEGSVEVKAEPKNTLLKPGQQLAMRGNELIITNVDVEPYLKLIDGLFYFDNATLESIMDFIGKWYGMNVEFRNHEAKKMSLHFIAEEDSGVERVIDRLNSIEKVIVKKHGNTLIIE